MRKTKPKHLADSSHKALKTAINNVARALSQMRLAYRAGRYEPIPNASAILRDVGKAMSGYTFYTKKGKRR